MGRRMDWTKAQWDSASAGARFELCNDATEADVAELEAIIRSRQIKRNDSIRAAREAALAGLSPQDAKKKRAQWRRPPPPEEVRARRFPLISLKVWL